MLLTRPPRQRQRKEVRSSGMDPSAELRKVPRLPGESNNTSHECKAHIPPRSQERSKDEEISLWMTFSCFQLPTAKASGNNQEGVKCQCYCFLQSLAQVRELWLLVPSPSPFPLVLIVAILKIHLLSLLYKQREAMPTSLWPFQRRSVLDGQQNAIFKSCL